MVSNEEFMGSLMRTQDIYASYGITTAQEGFLLSQLAPIYQYLIHANILKIDLIGFIDIDNAEEIKDMLPSCIKKYHNHVKVGGYKTFSDGSPQGRTAWMRTPYLGEEKDYYGYGTQKDEDIQAKCSFAIKDNMQLLVHCNGDAACEQFITQYGIAKDKADSENEIRPVIVHSQLLDKDQLDRVKELNMLPSFFVGHVYHWGDIHINNFGAERASRISLAKDALDKDILFTFHQDAPVIEPKCARNNMVCS